MSTNGASGVLGALVRLDVLLERGVLGARTAFGAHTADDPLRGLRLELADIAQLLNRGPSEPLVTAATAITAQHAEPLAALSARHDLTGFETDALLIALAPDVDLRYERLYAFLQDDVTMRRPTVDLVLNLLCVSAGEKVARREVFSPHAPLVRHGLIRLDGDALAPLLRRNVAADDQVVRWVLGTGGLDFRLAGACELDAPPADAPEPSDGAAELRLYFRGKPGSGRRAAARKLAHAAGRPLLAADAARLADGLAPTLAREATLHGACLYVHGIDELAERPGELRALIAAIAGHPGPVVLAGERPWLAPLDAPVVGFHTRTLGPPDARGRRALWRAELDRAAVALSDRDVDAVADRFALLPAQIAVAVADALATARARGSGDPDAAGLFAAARARTGHALGGLATKIDPVHHWEDIVLPDDTIAQLRELCSRVVHRERVLDERGFARKLSLGRGISALFTGPPGTGKTMAAEVIAHALGVDLYRVDLSGVVSKWIGETEKNLDRIFTAAEDANAILFFDEADALFGKRSEVKDSHDRHANIETAYLLQKIEQFGGVAILATNRRDNLDDAFLRRLSFLVRFPFPGAEQRERIWAATWPAETPLADDVDWSGLAQRLSFSGAEIRNIALGAAFLATEDDSPVTMAHVLHAVRRESEKSGRSFEER